MFPARWRVSACLFLTMIAGCGVTPIASSQSLLKRVSVECASSTDSAADLPEVKVNGSLLNHAETQNLAWIKKCILPALPGLGEDKIKILSEVVWWSLREGVLEQHVPAVFSYSNCHFKKNGDRLITEHPLQECETNIWQVGMMAGQAMNYSLLQIQNQIALLEQNLGSEATEESLLEWTANLAGYPPGSDMSRAIVASQGRLRRSWLVRNPLLAVLLVKTEVESECFEQSKDWCFSGSYDEAVKFSGSRARMVTSIQDIALYFLLPN